MKSAQSLPIPAFEELENDLDKSGKAGDRLAPNTEAFADTYVDNDVLFSPSPDNATSGPSSRGPIGLNMGSADNRIGFRGDGVVGTCFG